MLFLVCYSCITSMYYATFSVIHSEFLMNFDHVVEVFFWLDLLLNFIQSYVDVDTHEVVTDLKKIGWNYIRYGWFVVDFFSVFPFGLLLDSKGS